MAFSTGSDPVFASRQIKLDTLVRLRWLAILGQTAAILLVWLLLGYSFQPVLCLVLVGLSAWLNLYLHYYFRKSVRLPPLPATGLLSYDTCQLGGLLYLTGGLQNPFALLLVGSGGRISHNPTGALHSVSVWLDHDHRVIAGLLSSASAMAK